MQYEGAAATVYGIQPGADLAAAYYRNSIVHYFLGAAILETAMLGVADANEARDPVEVLWENVGTLRDLLKFEFFFPEKAQFQNELTAELALHDPQWQVRLRGRATEIEALVRSFRPLSTNLVLRPYLDAYAILANALVDLGDDIVADEQLLFRECRARSRQYLAQRLIRSTESASLFILRNALTVARHRHLLDDSEDHPAARRHAWAMELHALLKRARRIEAWSDERIDRIVRGNPCPGR
jgi:glycerol-3-phosphate O-acyltransferase